MADDTMKSRWRAKNHKLGYEAAENRKSKEVIREFEYMLTKYRQWPD